MAEEVRRNRTTPGGNLVGVLVRDTGDDLTNEEFTGLAMITLVGGLGNTASTISGNRASRASRSTRRRAG
jgi:cytochrome P450